MENLTPQQKKKLEKLLRLSKDGLPAIIEYLFELEDKMDLEIPQIKNIIAQVRGEKGENCILTAQDKRDIASEARKLLQDDTIAKQVLSLIEIDNEDIAKRAVKYIKIPPVKDGVTPDDRKLISLIKPLIPRALNGKDADEEVVTQKIYDLMIKDLPTLGEQFRDGLELLQDEERLDAKAIKNLPEFTQELGAKAGWGAHPLRIEQVGEIKTKIARTLNFKGTGAPTITQTPSGVTELDFTGGGSTWGSINGTLSDQADLQSALNLKYNASNPDGYISSYTETDTLASVTGRGATTDTTVFLLGGILTGNNIEPNADGVYTLGGGVLGNKWGYIYTYNLTASTIYNSLIKNTSGVDAIDVDNNYLLDNSGVNSIDWTSRELVDNAGNTALSWSSSGVRGVLGTASLPSYSFTGDANTGMWSPTADTLAWSTGGVERMRVLSSGNVAIGRPTTNSIFEVYGTGAGLRIDGAGGGTFLWFAGGNQPNSTLNKSGIVVANGNFNRGSMYFVVDTSTDGNNANITDDTKMMISHLTGNIGIGTGIASPTAVIHLKAGTAAAGTAPLKLTTGTVLTTPEVGAVEYNNTFHLTNSDATRRHIVTAPNTTKVTAGAPYTNDGYVTINVGGTDFRVMTTA